MTNKNYFELTSKQEEILELEKNQNELNKDVEMLKTWLEKQKHLPQVKDVALLKKLLYSNKFSLEKTKKKLDLYFSCRNVVPEFFENRDPMNEKLQVYLKCTTMLPLPKLTKDLSRVYIFRFETEDSNGFDILTHLQYNFAIFDLRTYFDKSQSEIIILDCGKMTAKHVLKFYPPTVTKAANIFVKAYSDRIKGVHFLNLPSYCNSFMLLITSLLKDKIIGRIQTHSNLESLHSVVPKELLPSDYNGDEPSVKSLNAEWRAYYESQGMFLTEQAKLRSNENLRDGTFTEEDVFGSIHGSFRTLNVD